MLKHRVITALIFGSGLIAAIYLLENSIVALLLALVILLAGWEWSKLSGFVLPLVRLLYCAVLAGLIWVAWTAMSTDINWIKLFVTTAVWWVLALLWVTSYPVGNQNTFLNQVVKSFAGILVLLPCWLGMVKLHEQGPEWLLYVLLLIWLADSGAYFVGKAWGKHKLAPKVSPGKSWEGVLGALLVTIAYSWLGVYWLGLGQQHLLVFLVLSLLLVPVSIIGDLFESMIKRHADMKDSGAILPGHGGILDRIDSWTAAVPVFVLVAIWQGWL